MNELARSLIVIGLVITLTGVALYWISKIPGLGKLPGDIIIKRENFTFYFPVVSSVLISLILSLILYLWHHR